MEELYRALDAIEKCFYGKKKEVIKPPNVPRLEKCNTAQDVFREFSSDAAAGKVEEMLKAKTSSDRQRAQETILGYGLGKPINRSLSYSVQLGDVTEEELNHGIKSLLYELGYTSGEGTSDRVFIGLKGAKRPVTITEVQTSSTATRGDNGISGEILEIDKEDKDLPNGEPRR